MPSSGRNEAEKRAFNDRNYLLGATQRRQSRRLVKVEVSPGGELFDALVCTVELLFVLTQSVMRLQKENRPRYNEEIWFLGARSSIEH